LGGSEAKEAGTAAVLAGNGVPVPFPDGCPGLCGDGSPTGPPDGLCPPPAGVGALAVRQDHTLVCEVVLGSKR